MYLSQSIEIATCRMQRHILIDFPQQRVLHDSRSLYNITNRHQIMRTTSLHVCAGAYVSGSVPQRKSPGGETKAKRGETCFKECLLSSYGNRRNGS